MKSKALFGLTLCAAFTVAAQNPIIHDQFTADPTARVFDGKVYLYPSHDIPSPVDRLKDWFCMADYHVFSSDNLVDWTDHGVIVSQESVPWVEPESYAMWAPDCVKKGDTYYFYFPASPKGGQRGFGVGVAMSQSPTGPFRPMWRPIEGIMGIDPCVLIDDDGQSYIYWSGMGIRGSKLKDNMMELDTIGQGASAPGRMSDFVPAASATADAPRPQFKMAGKLMEGLPEGFKEGPFAFKREGRYYLTFPWVRTEGATETLAYCMSDNPLGPWEFKGLIMEEHPSGCWTNHHSLIELDGQWYLFYHHNDYSPKIDKRRSARIDRVNFNPDGTIQLVKPTLRGVGVADARRPIQIDRYSDIGGGARVDFLCAGDPDTTKRFDGWKTIFDKKGAYVRFNDVNFGDRAPSLAKAYGKSRKGATLRIDAIGQDGKASEIATIKIPAAKNKVTGPYDGWTMVSTDAIKSTPTGVQDLMVTLLSGDAEIDYIGFDALPWSEGAMNTGRYRNVFAEMGYTEAQIDARLREICDSLFRGSNRIYFEVGDDMGYISDLKNHDVRTEGQSYGMMAAVQLDDKDMFDRIWRWSKHYMQHQEGDLDGYFRWSCKTDGTPNAQGPASDGELYYITALIFASNRWGNDTGINYLAEAQNILDKSMMKLGKNSAAPLIHPEHQLITFTPDPMGGAYTDPSYHIPAFYEVWANWADDGRSDYWRQCAARSRDYLHRATHPVTGLNPDYSAYDGSVMGRKGRMGFPMGEAFRFDSWRVPMNIALDYSWACADREWQNDYANRIQAFLYGEGINDFVDQYNIDGSQVDYVMRAGEHQKLRHSLGLVATSAAATLAATDPRCFEFVNALWDAKHEPYDDGYFDAYYDGLLRLFAFMHLSGRYRVITPQ